MDLIEIELEIGEQLLTLLQQEETLLLTNRVDGLSDSTHAKSILVSQFASASQNRLSGLAEQFDLPRKESSMLPWLTTFASSDEKTSWQRLISIARSAQELNRTNGLMLNNLVLRNQNSLSVLRGHAGHSFYGPAGQASSSSA